MRRLASALAIASSRSNCTRRVLLYRSTASMRDWARASASAMRDWRSSSTCWGFPKESR
jgi:hypothetical protein